MVVRSAVAAAFSVREIPSTALNAYQRAESIMDTADRACNIPWQLIAAIGRVESDHGRYGGNTLGVDGVSRPGIYGIPLNGTRSTAKIVDTDAGQYDDDTIWDRAVGPMQFIPSTWSVVAVDADGDATRNPQDIDDAALAAAVYLCSGNDNLSTGLGQSKAVFRYNHSDAYVRLVISIMDAYLASDRDTSVANYMMPAAIVTPDDSPTGPANTGPVEPGGPESAPVGVGGTQEPPVDPVDPDDVNEPPTACPTAQPVPDGDPVEDPTAPVSDVPDAEPPIDTETNTETVPPADSQLAHNQPGELPPVEGYADGEVGCVPSDLAPITGELPPDGPLPDDEALPEDLLSDQGGRVE